MNAAEIIRIARNNVHNEVAMRSSAEVCLADAIAQYDAGNLDSAKMWARKSLAYSVGVFHEDYKRAQA